MSRLVELGHGRLAHASGALWLAAQRTLLLADVHLGYGWALRRRGQLGPVGDDKVCRKLMSTVEELGPERIVFLGDLVHAPRPAAEERRAVETTLRALAGNAKLTVVLGNHDRAFGRDFSTLPVEICHEWTNYGLTAVHGDRGLPDADHLIAGHLHPALGVTDNAGACQRVPVFVSDEHLTLLPAFSPLAAGFDIRNGLPVKTRNARLVAASGTRAVDLGSLARVLSMP